MTKTPQRNEDAFLKWVADSTSNQLDLPSIYPLSPERYRVAVDGTRIDPAETTAIQDGQRDFTLTPDVGERVELYSAERPRYVVGYEAAASWAFEGLTDISANDTVRIGLTDRNDTGNGENTAYFEFTSDQQRCVLEKSDTEVDTATFEFPEGYDFQSFYRPEIQYNAYDAGRWLFTLSYTRSSNGVGEKQELVEVAELAVDDAGATNEYNFNLFFEVDSPDGATELSAGSMAYRILGDTDPTLRVKGLRLPDLAYDGTGDYEPVAALRKAPGRGNIFLELTQVSLLLADGSGECLIIAVPPDETDATGFSTPVQHSGTNSALETTTNVTTFPDATDTEVTSAANPGGYQIGFATWESVGTGTNARSGSDSIRRKRPIHNGDIAVVLVKRDSASATTANLTIGTEQDW